MKTSSSYGGHSALVRMRLLLNGMSFCIAQMGPDFLFVESPTDHPPARATIELQENLPYDYQRRLAGGDSGTECQSQLINIPTGLGKTALCLDA